MLNPIDQLALLKLIDERQLQVLEDLDRLTTRIESVIELHSSNRGQAEPDSGQVDQRPDVAA